MEIDDIICYLCESGEDDSVLTLCDGCDKGFHTYCLNLPAVPVGDWYCPACKRSGINMVDTSSAIPAPQAQLRPGLRVFLYERVSSKGQDAPEHGRVGMDTQNNTLLEFALNNSLVIRGTAREVQSARDPIKLKQLKSILQMIRQGECVVVYSVSRFSRNLQQGLEMLTTIHAAGGWVYSVTDDASSYDERFLLLLQEAQAESDRLSQKIRDAYARIRRCGGHIGPPPFGYTTYHDESGIRRLLIEPNEQKTLVALRRVYKRNQNASQTADQLNIRGILRRGKPWNKKYIVKSLGSLDNNTFSKDMLGALE